MIPTELLTFNCNTRGTRVGFPVTDMSTTHIMLRQIRLHNSDRDDDVDMCTLGSLS